MSQCDYAREIVWKEKKNGLKTWGVLLLEAGGTISPLLMFPSLWREFISPNSPVPFCLLNPSSIKLVPLDREASMHILDILVTFSSPLSTSLSVGK